MTDSEYTYRSTEALNVNKYKVRILIGRHVRTLLELNPIGLVLGRLVIDGVWPTLRDDDQDHVEYKYYNRKADRHTARPARGVEVHVRVHIDCDGDAQESQANRFQCYRNQPTNKQYIILIVVQKCNENFQRTDTCLYVLAKYRLSDPCRNRKVILVSESASGVYRFHDWIQSYRTEFGQRQESVSS